MRGVHEQNQGVDEEEEQSARLLAAKWAVTLVLHAQPAIKSIFRGVAFHLFLQK